MLFSFSVLLGILLILSELNLNVFGGNSHSLESNVIYFNVFNFILYSLFTTGIFKVEL